MKLNPPASSSDLDVARQIARRLHQTRRRDDRASTEGLDEAPVRPRLTPPPLPDRPAPAEPPEPPAVRAEPRPAPPPPPPAPQLEVDLDDEPAPPEPSFEPRSWREAAPPPAAESAALDDVDSASAPQLREAGEPSRPSEPDPGPEMPEMPDVDVDAAPLSQEEMVGEGAADPDASPLEGLTDPEPSPFDDEMLDAPPVAEEPVAPSWHDIAEGCRTIAQARGAMLVDPQGQVMSARGDWPAPGPEAIAGKLVVMMAKTLKDAPTRSISAPLMGMHLTAWRVPLGQELVTAAFIGPAAVRPDARPAIDAEITTGTL